MSRIFTRGTTTLIVCSHGIALFLEHMDDEQEPKISSEISPHINDKQLGRLNSYDDCILWAIVGGNLQGRFGCNYFAQKRKNFA